MRRARIGPREMRGRGGHALRPAGRRAQLETEEPLMSAQRPGAGSLAALVEPVVQARGLDLESLTVSRAGRRA